MKPIIAVAISTALLSLSGCANNGTWRVQARCSGLPSQPDCEVKGEVGGTWGGGKQKLSSLAEHALVATEVADAAHFAIDVSGSTISYPLSGTATLTLKNSSSGAIVATRDFGWKRTGSLLMLVNPDAVNSWALENGAGADALAYRLKPFPLSSGFGQQRIVAKSMYEGAETASSSSDFYRCTPYPSRYQCAQ